MALGCASLLLQDRAPGWHPRKITLGEAVINMSDIKYRWIVYLCAFPGQFEVKRVASLREARDVFFRYGIVRDIENTWADLYAYDDERWASAMEYENIGNPFDYMDKRLTFGPRQGVRVEAC